jgi:sodium/bile acid cotransporter 7
VQLFNFGFVSVVVFGITRLLIEIRVLVPSLADGMVICACLPMAINMVQILTKTADGDEAAAIFNAAFSNLAGVFLSPLLILAYLGVSGNDNEVDIVAVFYKLFIRVVLPLIVGQLLQKTSKVVVDFVKKYKKYFSKAQIYALVFIVYTVFCTTFVDGATDEVGIGNIFLVLFFQLVLLCTVTTIAWFMMKFLFPNKPRLRVTGIFGTTFKTVSVGVPLINAMYQGNPNIGLYTLPLLIWHPMQLVLGSFLAPRLHRFVQREKERLGIVDDDLVKVKSHEGGIVEATGEMSAIDEEEGDLTVINIEQPILEKTP